MAHSFLGVASFERDYDNMLVPYVSGLPKLRIDQVYAWVFYQPFQEQNVFVRIAIEDGCVVES